MDFINSFIEMNVVPDTINNDGGINPGNTKEGSIEWIIPEATCKQSQIKPQISKTIDYAKCPICLKVLNKNLPSSSPYLFSCGHYVCHKCNDTLKAYGNSRCHTCRQQLKGDMHIVQYDTSAQLETLLDYNLCPIHNIPITLFCTVDRSDACEKCAIDHIGAGHSLMPSYENNESMTSKVLAVQKLYAPLKKLKIDNAQELAKASELTFKEVELFCNSIIQTIQHMQTEFNEKLNLVIEYADKNLREEVDEYEQELEDVLESKTSAPKPYDISTVHEDLFMKISELKDLYFAKELERISCIANGKTPDPTIRSSIANIDPLQVPGHSNLMISFHEESKCVMITSLAVDERFVNTIIISETTTNSIIRGDYSFIMFNLDGENTNEATFLFIRKLLHLFPRICKVGFHIHLSTLEDLKQLFEIILPFCAGIGSIILNLRRSTRTQINMNMATLFVSMLANMVNLVSLTIIDNEISNNNILPMLTLLTDVRLPKLSEFKLTTCTLENYMDKLTLFFKKISCLTVFSIWMRGAVPVDGLKSLVSILSLESLCHLETSAIRLDTVMLGMQGIGELITLYKTLANMKLHKIALVLRYTDVSEDPVRQILGAVAESEQHNLCDFQLALNGSSVYPPSFEPMVKAFFDTLSIKHRDSEAKGHWELMYDTQSMTAKIIRKSIDTNIVMTL
jgi:hypothetical protein